MKSHGRTIALAVALACGLGSASRADNGTTESETTPYFRTRELEIPFRVTTAGAAPIHAYQLWYTSDGGKSWKPYGPTHRGDTTRIPFTAPADGVYGFKVLPRDLAQREPLPPQPGTEPDRLCVVDTTPPEVSVRRPHSDEKFFAGHAISIEWEAFDAHLTEQPVRVEWRIEADDPWQACDDDRVHYGATGTTSWFAPLASGTLELRVRALDRAGNETIWTAGRPLVITPFDGFRGARTIIADPYSAFRSFPIHYHIAAFQPHEVKRVEIWSRYEHGGWTRHVDPNGQPYEFEADRDGRYYFYLRVVDHNEKADRPEPGSDTLPDTRVIVDTHPPLGTLAVADGRDRVAHEGGELLDVRWKLREPNLPRNGADLECSLDGGQTWVLLQSGLDTRRDQGHFTWRPPLLKSEALRLRLKVRDLAGNRSEIAAPTRVQLINPRLDPVRTAEHHYRRALHFARLRVPGEIGRRSQLLQALENLDVALTYDAEYAEAWHDRGVILTLLEEYPRALENFQRACELRPADISFAFHLVRAHLRMVDAGLDPERTHLALAESVLARVSPEAIYSEPPDKYRDLFNRYHILKGDLEERRLAQ